MVVGTVEVNMADEEATVAEGTMEAGETTGEEVTTEAEVTMAATVDNQASIVGQMIVLSHSDQTTAPAQPTLARNASTLHSNISQRKNRSFLAASFCRVVYHPTRTGGSRC